MHGKFGILHQFSRLFVIHSIKTVPQLASLIPKRVPRPHGEGRAYVKCSSCFRFSLVKAKVFKIIFISLVC